MKDPVKELNRVLVLCGGQPIVFTQKDIEEARQMGVIIDPSNPGIDLFHKALEVEEKP